MEKSVAPHRLSYETDITMFCAAANERHCAASGLWHTQRKQWLLGARHPWDIWWWEVACKFYNGPHDVCQSRWLSTVPSCPSGPSIQAPSIHKVTQKALWCLIWTSRGLDWLWITFKTRSPCGFNLICKNQISHVFLLFRLNRINLNTIWTSQNLIWCCSLNKACASHLNALCRLF